MRGTKAETMWNSRKRKPCGQWNTRIRKQVLIFVPTLAVLSFMKRQKNCINSCSFPPPFLFSVPNHPLVLGDGW